MKTRNHYTKSFKLEAIRLLEESEKPAADVARELGIRRNMLYKWKEQLIDKGQDRAFKGPGRNAAVGNRSELTNLKRRLAELEEENAILKKAAAYFAKELS
ncbi:MAG: transposase [Halothiobacillus sp.]|jgi:transposase-like protein|nr:transposase [Halothiobacillus sp.]